MKTLTLIRHAKSSWQYDVQDIDRPLSTRGQNDANLLSKELLTSNFHPDAIYSSPANRALTTCHMFMENLNFEKEMLEVTQELYDFGGNRVLKFIRNLNNNYNDVLIFGHNHAFTSVVNDFGDEIIDNVPTCGLVKINFDIDEWHQLKPGKTVMTLFPKELK